MTVTHRDNCPVADEPLRSEGVRVAPVLGVAVEGVEVDLHEAAPGQGPAPHLHQPQPRQCDLDPRLAPTWTSPGHCLGGAMGSTEPSLATSSSVASVSTSRARSSRLTWSLCSAAPPLTVIHHKIRSSTCHTVYFLPDPEKYVWTLQAVEKSESKSL